MAKNTVKLELRPMRNIILPALLLTVGIQWLILWGNPAHRIGYDSHKDAPALAVSCATVKCLRESIDTRLNHSRDITPVDVQGSFNDILQYMESKHE